MHDKDEHSSVELERRALGHDAERDVLEDPAVVQPVGHEAVERERGRDGRALEVLALARGVLGQRRDGHVEAREAREPAEDEEGQPDRVGKGAEAEREGDHGGCHAEGDLVHHDVSLDSLGTRWEECVCVLPTRSARESSSCPIKLLFFLHRATLPSKASKKKPNGRNTSATHRWSTLSGSPSA